MQVRKGFPQLLDTLYEEKIEHTSMAVSNLYNECFTSLELDNRIYDEHE